MGTTKMFSFGTEYLDFLDVWCLRCANYTDWANVSIDSPLYKIEERLAIAAVTGESKDWPDEVVFEQGSVRCRAYRGKEG